MTALALLPPVTEKWRTTETALEIASDLTSDEWTELGHTLGRANRASAWWVGDWINYGETKWGEKYDDAVTITGLTNGTLRTYAHVARRFPIVMRHNKLSFDHHMRAASLPAPEQREELLTQAEEEGWDRARMRAELAPHKTSEPVQAFEITSKRQRDLANASKLRIEKAVGTCNGLARGIPSLKVEQAVAAASSDDIAGWDESIRDAIYALKRLRARLKEAS